MCSQKTCEAGVTFPSTKLAHKVGIPIVAYAAKSYFQQREVAQQNSYADEKLV